MARRLLFIGAVIIIVLLVIISTDLVSMVGPGTTFNNEVIKNIEKEGRQITSFDISNYLSNNEFTIENKEDISRLTGILSSMKLKKTKDVIEKRVWIDVKVNGERRYSLALSDDNSQISIIDYKNRKIIDYTITDITNKDILRDMLIHSH